MSQRDKAFEALHETRVEKVMFSEHFGNEVSHIMKNQSYRRYVLFSTSDRIYYEKVSLSYLSHLVFWSGRERVREREREGERERERDARAHTSTHARTRAHTHRHRRSRYPTPIIVSC